MLLLSVDWGAPESSARHPGAGCIYGVLYIFFAKKTAKIPIDGLLLEFY
jgi:hypothetical protein